MIIRRQSLTELMSRRRVRFRRVLNRRGRVLTERRIIINGSLILFECIMKRRQLLLRTVIDNNCRLLYRVKKYYFFYSSWYCCCLRRGRCPTLRVALRTGLILSRGQCKYNSLHYSVFVMRREGLILPRGRRKYNSLQYGRTCDGMRAT